MRSSSVSINLKKDQILIKLNENAEQENIVEALKKKLPELKKLYKEEKTPIKVAFLTLEKSFCAKLKIKLVIVEAAMSNEIIVSKTIKHLLAALASIFCKNPKGSKLNEI